MEFSYIYCGSADGSTANTMPTKKPFRVLSLFDGISGGQIALKELGIEPDEYLASEIDKTAISQTQHNFPNTIQLGDVRDLDARKLGHIDLLIGGSPCFAAGTKVLTKQGYKNIVKHILSYLER